MNIEKVKFYILQTIYFLKDKSSPVGCILISGNGKSAFFCNEGKEHCEQIVCRSYKDLSGCSIFLTLEPCFSCIFLLLRQRIKNIFFGAYNTEHGALGGKINVVEMVQKMHVPNYWGGILKQECECFIKDFFQKKRYKNLKNKKDF